MRKYGKNLLSLVLALVMVLGMLPISAFAENDDRIHPGFTDLPTMAKTTITISPDSTDNAGDTNVTSGTCGDNLTWTLDNGVLTISGTGEMENYSLFSYAPWYSQRETITSAIIGDGITSIGKHAFAECMGLTSVTIPNSVTSIGYDAFYKCSCLTSVIIPDSVTCIEGRAFEYSGLTSVTIPNSVTSIGTFAFNNCTSLTSATIPDSVTNIEAYAFNKCCGLTSVTIPNSITGIEEYVFAFCEGLTSVTIPNSVTSIGRGVFYYCDALTDIYYKGTQLQWNAIAIDIQNDPLLNATIHCNSTGTSGAVDSSTGTSISMDDEPYNIHVGEEGTLSADIHNIQGSCSWSWSSSDSRIISFSETPNGMLVSGETTLPDGFSTSASYSASIKFRALTPGTTTVTCTLATGESASREIIVTGNVSSINLDVKVTLDPRTVEYSGGKMRFEDGNFEGKSKFEIPVTITVTNTSTFSGATAQASARQSKDLAVTFDNIDIVAPSGFNFGWFNGGEIKLKSPITLNVGESWKSEQGYIRANTWFKPEAIQNEYSVHATVMTNERNFYANQTFSIKNLDLARKSVSELADKAGRELKRIKTDEFTITALQLVNELGLTGDELDMFKCELIAQIVMSNTPKKTFQQNVDEKTLKQVFGYKPHLGASTYELPLTYIFSTSDYGKVKLKLTCKVQNYNWDAETFGSIINIDYQILSTKRSLPARIHKSGIFGAIYNADIEEFSRAAYSFAEVELNEAFNTGWGNTADEVARLIFGETVSAILTKCNTSYKDVAWKLITAVGKSISVRCPVDVFVYDESGQLCGSIEDNKIIKSSDDFELLVVDDEKHILGLKDSYTVKYVATDSGTMSVEIVEFYGYDCPMEVVKFNDVLLTKNKECSQNIPEAIMSDDGAYDLTSDSGQTIQPDETLDLIRDETEDALTFSDVPSDSWYAAAVQWAVAQGITNGTSVNPATFSPARTCKQVEILTFLWRAAGEPNCAVQLPFTPKNDWAEGALRWGYTMGMINASFDENAPCTRATTVKFMWLAAGSPSASGSEFSDVPANADYAQAVSWAVNNGITNGTGVNPPTFSPNGTCTRAEIVTLLYRAK